MSKPTMPEPVAWFYEYEDGQKVLTTSLDAIQRSSKAWRSLITTTQAEAYAAARVAESQRWQPIETAPHETDLLLGWKDWSGDWITEVSPASWGWKNERVSNISKHGQATHWMPLPTPPLPGPVEP